MTERGNDEWVADLRTPGPRAEAATADLCALLRRGLRRALAGRAGADDASVDDWAQDAAVKVLARLDDFRGDSRFTTWAVAVAVRVAFTELRRARWKDVSLEQVTGGAEPADPADPAAGPERQAEQRDISAALRRVLDRDLTDRQREVVRAELAGMPQDELARRLGMTRNALYKLGHDARKKLRAGLEAAGITADEVRSAFDL